MTSREGDRRSAKMQLVRSSELNESERVWAPNDPLGYSTRWARIDPNFYESLFDGRNKKEMRRVALKLVALFGSPFLMMPLVMILDSYQSNIGVPLSLALVFVNALVIFVMDFYLYRSMW